MEVLGNNIERTEEGMYECKMCAFTTRKLSNLKTHMASKKHKKNADGSKKNATGFQCTMCNKIYQTSSGLWKHSKVCTGTLPATAEVIQSPDQNGNEFKELFLLQQQENNELKKLLLEQQEQHHKEMNEKQEQHSKEIKELIPQIQQVTNITNNTNNSNNRFNLNFFLNEQCKDAISIQNFIENLNIGLPELEHMGNVGYVQGMMSIFSNTLGAMDIYKRPLHCTDLKRETLYIKQGNTWKKDTEDKTELKKLIKTVEYKNYGSLRLWEREHPEAFECDTQDNIDYMRISNESLGGFDSTDAIKLGKIMKHIVKEVYIK